jgi:hypothetical protein
MDYDYNKKVFGNAFGSTSIDSLIAAYTGCIVLELSLKQALGLVHTNSNGGHDLRLLINRLAQINPKHSHAYKAFDAQLVNTSKKIICQGRNGTPLSMPPSSYPHIRYVRHSSDWTSSSTSDADIDQFLGLIQRIINHLKTVTKVIP